MVILICIFMVVSYIESLFVCLLDICLTCVKKAPKFLVLIDYFILSCRSSLQIYVYKYSFNSMGYHLTVNGLFCYAEAIFFKILCRHLFLILLPVTLVSYSKN